MHNLSVVWVVGQKLAKVAHHGCFHGQCDPTKALNSPTFEPLNVA